MPDRRTFWIAALVALVVVLAVIYYFVDPMEVRWMPKCFWKMMTGTECPGCGSQRMAHALTHGDLRGAWEANAYALCMVPLICFMVWLEFFRERHPRLYRRVYAPVAVWMLVASVLVWWVVRNLV